MHTNGQMMQEFMITMVIVVLVTGIALYVSVQHSDEINTIKTKESAESLCKKISSTIDYVWSMGRGSAIILDIPTQINYVDYDVQINSFKTVVVSYQMNSFICPFSANVINDTVTLQHGKIKIYNDNTGVVVTSV